MKDAAPNASAADRRSSDESQQKMNASAAPAEMDDSNPCEVHPMPSPSITTPPKKDASCGGGGQELDLWEQYVLYRDRNGGVPALPQKREMSREASDEWWSCWRKGRAWSPPWRASGNSWEAPNRSFGLNYEMYFKDYSSTRARDESSSSRSVPSASVPSDAEPSAPPKPHRRLGRPSEPERNEEIAAVRMKSRQRAREEPDENEDIQEEMTKLMEKIVKNKAAAEAEAAAAATSGTPAQSEKATTTATDCESRALTESQPWCLNSELMLSGRDFCAIGTGAVSHGNDAEDLASATEPVVAYANAMKRAFQSSGKSDTGPTRVARVAAGTSSLSPLVSEMRKRALAVAARKKDDDEQKRGRPSYSATAAIRKGPNSLLERQKAQIRQQLAGGKDSNNAQKYNNVASSRLNERRAHFSRELEKASCATATSVSAEHDKLVAVVAPNRVASKSNDEVTAENPTEPVADILEMPTTGNSDAPVAEILAMPATVYSAAPVAEILESASRNSAVFPIFELSAQRDSYLLENAPQYQEEEFIVDIADISDFIDLVSDDKGTQPRRFVESSDSSQLAYPIEPPRPALSSSPPPPSSIPTEEPIPSEADVLSQLDSLSEERAGFLRSLREIEERERSLLERMRR